MLLLLLFFLPLSHAVKVMNQSELTDMEYGMLPHLTKDQQMQLFGGFIEASNLSWPWWKAIEEGLMPPLDENQQLHLFGSKVEMTVAEEKNKNDKSRSLSEESEIYNFKIHNLLPEEVEGRGRLKKILVPVLLALTIFAAIALPALMTVIKLIAVKGLWSGVVSLIISKLLGLKALLNHHHHHHDHDHETLKRPLVFYVPHGKNRREEYEHSSQNPAFDQWAEDNWEYWNKGDNAAQVRS